MRFLILIAFIFFCGCSSVRINPRTISAAHKPTIEREAALSCFIEAVAIANEFLASDFRKTLPDGRLILEEDRLQFVQAERTIPIVIRCTWTGDILPSFGMTAQERSNGFVVGAVSPCEDRAIDNSLFKFPGSPVLKSWDVAGVILHELTHQAFGVGTVTFT